jgi:hypothetical protein
VLSLVNDEIWQAGVNGLRHDCFHFMEWTFVQLEHFVSAIERRITFARIATFEKRVFASSADASERMVCARDT